MVKMELEGELKSGENCLVGIFFFFFGILNWYDCIDCYFLRFL